MPQGIIHTERSNKRYHGVTAVEDVSIDVSAGEVVGFLGPNGAGKSTTVAILTTRELLELQCALFGAAGRLAAERARRLLELVKPADVAGRRDVWSEVRRLNRERGMTIFLTTRYLEKADELADRIAIIDRGRIVSEGTPSGLKQALGAESINVVCESATFLFFPLSFLTATFVPLKLLEGWLGAAATANPITYILEASRSLINTGRDAHALLLGAAAAGGMFIALFGLAAFALSTRTRRR